MFEMLSY